jgi:hypothetical protein
VRGSRYLRSSKAVKKGLTPLAAWRIVCKAATVVLVGLQGSRASGLFTASRASRRVSGSRRLAFLMARLDGFWDRLVGWYARGVGLFFSSGFGCCGQSVLSACNYDGDVKFYRSAKQMLPPRRLYGFRRSV